LDQCILHLGSNTGNPEHNIEMAEVMIAIRIGMILQKSNIYYTEPWGNKNQNYFLNLALKVSTNKSPEEILQAISIIENKMGRERIEKWGPRLIDIDIIFYGDAIIKNDCLEIPHPALSNRNFVLVPLMDICPDFIHPESKKSINEIFLESTDEGKVRQWR